MKYFLPIVFMLAIAGCDRPDAMEEESSTHPANPNAKQTPTAPQSDTLKVTYSRKDPLKIAPPSPKTAPMKMDEPGSHGDPLKSEPSMEKMEKKSEHEGHSQK